MRFVALYSLSDDVISDVLLTPNDLVEPLGGCGQELLPQYLLKARVAVEKARD